MKLPILVPIYRLGLKWAVLFTDIVYHTILFDWVLILFITVLLCVSCIVESRGFNLEEEDEEDDDDDDEHDNDFTMVHTNP
jgi:hypothetical protein